MVEKYGYKPTKQDISNRRIFLANEIASHDSDKFEKLIAFFNKHPYWAFNIMREYRDSPNSRFEEKLLIFCYKVDHRLIKFGEKGE
jgi:hypothetical protein